MALLVAFAAVLYLVSLTLTAGGIGGAAFPYAGPIFLAFLGFAGGLLGALHGMGVTGWVSRLSEEHRAFSIVVLLLCAFALPFTEAGSQYWMQVAATIGVYAATAIGLNIVVGLAGLLDLGYVAFLGIGAFVAANLSGAARLDGRLEPAVPARGADRGGRRRHLRRDRRLADAAGAR